MREKTNYMIRFLAIPVTIILTGLVLALPVSALLQLPHAFYGNITIDGEPAPIGTVVEARCQGAKVGINGNPIMTTEVGKYGSESELGVKLIVQGEDIDGNPLISFYIDGHLADQTYTWQTGEITRLDLSVTISTAPENGQGTGPPQTMALQCSFFGKERYFPISKAGDILESIEISSSLPSGKITVSINVGTRVLDNDGNPLIILTSDADLTPPPAAEDYTVYMACSFGPDGTTFAPPIILVFEYDPAGIPEDTDEEDLVIAFYDSSIEEWVPLECEVDTVNHTITASVSHFTTFAVMVPEVEPPPETPSSTPPVPEPEEIPAPAPPSPEPESAAPEPEPTTPEPTLEEEPSEPQTPSAPEEPEPSSDGNFFIIIAAVIVGGIGIAFLIRWIILREKRQQ